MPGYHTRSHGARAALDNPPNPPTTPAESAGTVPQTAGQLQAANDQTIGSQHRSSEDSVINDLNMANYAQSIKDPKILMLRSEFNSAHKQCDEKYKEVEEQIKLIEQAKQDSTIPKAMIHSYSETLAALLSQGNVILEKFTKIRDSLNTQLNYLSLLQEDQPELKAPIDAQIEKVRSTFSPYKGKFKNKGEQNKHLLTCLFSTETAAPPAPVQTQSTTTIGNQRKDYSYLKPTILSSDCTRRELSKFFSECSIWIEKSLTPEDREDTRLVWASVRAVLDGEWTEVLSRDEHIASRTLDTIHSMMSKIYLEKNPLIVQRLSALRIQKLKEESISDCLRKIFDAYQSAELKDCPLETLALLHLVTLLPADPLSDRIKAHLVETMRLEPNLTSLESVTTFILSQEADDVAKRSTLQQANRVNQITEVEKEPEKEKKKIKCRACLKSHVRGQCKHECGFCGKPGHRQEFCWIKNPKLAPPHLAHHLSASSSLPPAGKDKREHTPGPPRSGRSRRRSSKSDRGSSYERSASEPETPPPRGPKKRHRSNRVRVTVPPASESTSSGLAALSLFGPPGQLGSSQHQNLLFPEDPQPERRINRIRILASPPTHLFGSKVEIMEPVETMIPTTLFNEDLGLNADMVSDMENVATAPHIDTSFNLSSLFESDSSEKFDPQCWAEESSGTSIELSSLFRTESLEELDLQCGAEKSSGTPSDLSSLFGSDSSEEIDPQCWAEESSDTSFNLSSLFGSDSSERLDPQCWAEESSDTSIKLSSLFRTESSEKFDLQRGAEKSSGTSIELSSLFRTESLEELDLQCGAEKSSGTPSELSSLFGSDFLKESDLQCGAEESSDTSSELVRPSETGSSVEQDNQIIHAILDIIDLPKLTIIVIMMVTIMQGIAEPYPEGTEYMNNHCSIINNSRLHALSASTTEVIHSPGRAFHISGKNPESSRLPILIPQSVMETNPAPAAAKMMELMAITILTMLSIALGLTIGLRFCWLWRSNYLRELITSVLRSWLSSDQQGEPHPSPIPMDDHEDSDSSSSADGYNSGDSDDTVLVVSGPSGTWLVSQVSGPKEELPEPVQVLQHLQQ